jgi:hyaluronoglucosaminidase
MVEIGIIEGYYGRPWSWSERHSVLEQLATRGYRFFLYAPKADLYLRRRWAEPFPPELLEALRGFSSRCRELGVRFGVGLSPYELHTAFDERARTALRTKLESFRDIGIDDLGILFDDMRGDLPDLAARQIEIVEWIADRASADRLIVCPSYYTDDIVLDRVFGQRPDGYLEELGTKLDPSIHLFWTGEEVCSREISPAHVDRVAEQMRRIPFLWDNYPVNDGQRMSQYLHLRAFTGRSAALAGRIAAHGVNPALQPTLSLIPALTLREVYAQGERYAYGHAFLEAATEVLGESLAHRLREDLLVLQDVGLDRLADRASQLRERWSDVTHPAAVEIVTWLDGGYRITDEIVQTQ